jgi:hypothetical protein
MTRSAQTTDFDFTHRSLPTEVDTQRRSKNLYLLLSLTAVLIFAFAGALMLPLLGLQTDEVMFVHDLWHPREAFYSISFQRLVIPSMVTSYAGELKCWLYAPLLKIAPFSVWAVRFPVLVLAAATILLTGKLLRQIQGRTAALIGVGLLATDVTFLVTAVFDWGPVVIQNLLLVAGILLVLKWYRGRRDVVLFLAGLVFGLNLWNKALFLWNLSGLAIALLLIALPEVIRVWRWKAAGLFLLGLCIGASPLIQFNLGHRGATLQQNSHLTVADVGNKAHYLRSALDGQEGTFALVDPTRKGVDHIPRAFEHLSLAAAKAASNDLRPGPSLWRVETGLVLIVAGLLAADRSNRKWILFFLISGLIGWFESAITIDAGASIHHTVLFWINWYCAVSLGTAAIPRLRPRVLKPILGLLIAVLCIRGLFLLNLEYAHLISYDASTSWTDADANLATHLTRAGVTRAITVDWGIANPVNLRSKNRIFALEDAFVLKSGTFDKYAFEDCQTADCVVIAHVPERSIFPGAYSFLDDSLRQAHFAKSGEEHVDDSHGFPVYSVFRVRDERPKSSTGSGGGDLTGAPSAQALAAPGPPRLIADPAVIVSPSGLGETTLVWRAPANLYVEIHIGSPDGPLFASSTGPGSARTGLWVKNGLQFYLQDRSNDNPLTADNTLARTQLEVRTH